MGIVRDALIECGYEKFKFKECHPNYSVMKEDQYTILFHHKEKHLPKLERWVNSRKGPKKLLVFVTDPDFGWLSIIDGVMEMKITDFTASFKLLTFHIQEPFSIRWVSILKEYLL